MPRHLRTLLLGFEEAEARALTALLERLASFETAQTIPEMLRLAARQDFDALLCAWSFPAGTWRDALREIRIVEPELLTVVVCRTGQEAEWLEALDAGAFDLLAAPYSESAVVRLLEQVAANCRKRALGAAA